MKLLKRFLRYMNPDIDPKVIRDMDRQSIRNIHIISVILMVFEILALIVFLYTHIGHFDHDAMIVLISVSYCIVLGLTAYSLSGKMLKKNDLPHSRFFLFKIVFYVAFFAWAMLVDYRHYRAGDQMMTFYIVNLVTVCFILFRPWIGAILVTCVYAGMFTALYTLDGAAGIQPLNYIALALASMASNAVRYLSLARGSSKAVRLTENNQDLENTSRHDGLTGLMNRVALEEDAAKMDGQKMTVYMIDINYFKEINDQYGHVAGDEILRETSRRLKHLFPSGHYYRYGGDEFLVITYRPAEENYGADTYDFVQEEYGVKVLLSIGNAQGSPKDEHELFDLISRADKALYVTKQRTHSAEFGGHDRRKHIQTPQN